jgi:hypothetical protein
MDLSKILAISGKNGLYRVVSQAKNSLIVESLVDGRKMPVFPTDRTSSLEDISLFTTGEDMSLREVLLKIFEAEDGKPSIDPKAPPAELAARLESILPEYDKERVYPSDIKKLFAWYALLLEKGLIDKEEAPEEAEGAHGEEGPNAEAPAKAAAKPKPASKAPAPQVDSHQPRVETPKRTIRQKK